MYSRTRPADEAFPSWVQEIVQGPRSYGISWPIYYTRGYLFHTKDYGEFRKTMNYGVCVRGQNFSDAADEADFYGNVQQIIELQYLGLVGLKITVFKCDWYDPTIGRGTRVKHGGIVDVLSTGKYPKYEPFILASQADQVCYIPYPSTRRPREQWLNVMKVNPRGNIVGKFKGKELILLQQENDYGDTTVEELPVGRLADDTNQREYLDMTIMDEEPDDEFQCNLSSSDDGDEVDEVPEDD